MIEKEISHYRILRKIGEGGMGEVYLAEDLRLKRNVALKFLSSKALFDQDAKIRFIKEAQAASSLQHNNICTVHEISETEEGQLFMCMDYYEGETLKNRIKRKPLETNEAVKIVFQLSKGLQAAHQNKIIHRDLKPENIFITNSGEVKILDFGISKVLDGKNVTKVGGIIGTAAYMSPEQLKGEEVDSRTDIWSLGVVFYELLTSELPFKGEADQAVIYSIISEEPVPASQKNKSVFTDLDKIINRMLSKTPGSRYRNFDELINELLDFVKQEDIHLQLTTSVRNIRSKKEKYFAAFLVFIVLLLSIITYLYTSEKTSEGINIKLIVLPFTNLGDPADEYFSEGMFDETISRLAHINGLSVVPRSKAVFYSYDPESISELKDELSVEYIVDGTVRWIKNGENFVRIIVDLIRLEDEELLWSKKYEGQLNEIFDIQTQIAEQLAKQLDVVILEPEREALREAPTRNVEAYNAMIEARKILRDSQQYGRERRIEGYLRANELYEKAIDLDSSYMAAYINLSHNHTFLYDYGYDKTEERRRMARNVLERLIEVHPNNPLARSQLAIYLYRVEENYQRAYEILIEINKEYPNQGILWMGIVERRLGLWQKAKKHLLEFVDMYPMGDDGPLILGHIYHMLREYQQADEAYQKSINNHPDFLYAIAQKAFNHISWNGDIENAMAEWNRLPDSGRTSLWKESFLKYSGNYVKLIEMIDAQENQFTDMQSIYFVKYTELALVNYFLNNSAVQKLYADSAVSFLLNVREDKVTDANYHDVLGLSYGLAGIKEKAVEHGRRAVELCPITKDALDGAVHHQNLACIYSILGMDKEAVEELKLLLTIPSSVSIPYIKTDPHFDNIRESESYKNLLLSY